MSITIYHNPACGTSRNTLALIRGAGIEPTIVEYLKTPPDRATLAALVRKSGGDVRGLLRERGTPFAELGLGDPKWSEAQLIGFLVAHPILLNRPVVETARAARVCRPAEVVLELLPASKKTPQRKWGAAYGRAKPKIEVSRSSSGDPATRGDADAAAPAPTPR